jgi:hypothetical protein
MQWGFKWDNPTGFWYYAGMAAMASSNNQPEPTKLEGTPFTLDELEQAVSAGGGWLLGTPTQNQINVVHSCQSSSLAQQLVRWGFHWNKQKQLWTFGVPA